MEILNWVLAIGGGYLLGSIPFGLLLTYVAGYGDIRKIGSGNIGATNVLRTGNKPLALAVLILDTGKGAIAALVAWWLFGWHFGVFAGTFAFLGHLYPVWLGFKGGKGIATGLGTFLGISWPIFIGMALTWLAAAFLSRRSSVGGLAAFGVLPLLIVLFDRRAGLYTAITPFWFILLGFVLAGIVFYKHRANISRIIDGTEPKISFGRGSKKGEDESEEA